MTEENHEKTPVRLVGTGIRTRDLPDESLVRYHGATSLGTNDIVLLAKDENTVNSVLIDLNNSCDQYRMKIHVKQRQI